ncbi:MAG: FAD-dependent oxidoreductase, partial [Rhodoferax sp.]|nr:FAD-dependent oxidoreductase [Rhodoferax sp.]
MKAYETLVMGGGLSGLSCAIALAKAGNKVLLVESRSSLAWECTRAYELALSNTTTVIGELIKSRLTEVGGFDGQLADATILEMLVYRLCREYKIEVLLYTSPIHVHIEKSRVQGLWLGGKGSMRYVQAEWFIDATEDAVLWKQTQTAWKSVDVPARFRTYFNHLQNPIGSTIQLDSNLRICPTLWKSEACLELTLPSADYLGAWRELVRVLPGVRSQIVSLQPGVISNTALEVFPLAPRVEVEVLGQRHPKLGNLIGAGVWCGGTEVGIDKRMQWGEGAARLILGEKTMKNAKKLIADPPLLDWASLGADQVQYDVTIIGGGTGGVMAALASAREGARTLLVEQGPVLGGMTTGGGIHEPVRGREGKLVEELFALHNHLLPLFGGSQWKPYRPKRNHPEAMKASLLQLLSEAGIEVMYGTSMVSSVVVPGDDSGTRIAEVLVATPKGLKRIKSSTYVDSTGDGDLARASGASFRFGRDRDGRPHAYTLPGPFFQEDYLRWYNNDNGFV